VAQVPENTFCQALRWAIETEKSVSGVLELEQLRRLEQRLVGDEPWDAESYPTLRLLAQVFGRIESPFAAAPPNLACGLSALRERLRRGGGTPRSAVSPEVSLEVLEKLGIRDSGRGLDEQRRQNEVGWTAHGLAARAFVAKVAAGAPGRHSALVLGAGRLYDIPLVALLERFETVCLVDLELGTIERALESEGLATPERARVRLVGMDLTGAGAAWVACVDQALTQPTKAAAGEALVQELQTFISPLGSDWLLGDAPGYDLVVSQMVLSQLNDPLERYVKRAFAARFGAPDEALERRLNRASAQFAHLLQHEHLLLVAGAGELKVACSDVTEQLYTMGPRGEVSGLTEELVVVGAHQLSERLPGRVAPLARDEWLWHRAVPKTPGAGGARVRVQAVAWSSTGMVRVR
jgi:hypothetical protein